MNRDERPEAKRPSFWWIYHYSQPYFQSDEKIAAAVKEMAENGDNEAMLRMAILYFNAQGVCYKNSAKDEEFNYWLRQAVVNNNIRAKFVVAKEKSFAHTPFGFSDSYIRLQYENEFLEASILKEAAYSGEEEYFLSYYAYTIAPRKDDRNFPEWKNFDFGKMDRLGIIDYIFKRACDNDSYNFYLLSRYHMYKTPPSEPILQSLSRDADNGSTKAMLYLHQVAVKQGKHDDEHKWLASICDTNDMEAHEELSRNITQNDDAFNRYVKKAENGVPRAKYLLAIAKYNKLPQSSDKTSDYTAIMELLKDSSHSVPAAYYFMGRLYESEEGKLTIPLKQIQVKTLFPYSFNEDSTNENALAAMAYLHGGNSGNFQSMDAFFSLFRFDQNYIPYQVEFKKSPQNSLSLNWLNNYMNNDKWLQYKVDRRRQDPFLNLLYPVLVKDLLYNYDYDIFF